MVPVLCGSIFDAISDYVGVSENWLRMQCASIESIALISGLQLLPVLHWTLHSNGCSSNLLFKTVYDDSDDDDAVSKEWVSE